MRMAQAMCMVHDPLLKTPLLIIVRIVHTKDRLHNNLMYVHENFIILE